MFLHPWQPLGTPELPGGADAPEGASVIHFVSYPEVPRLREGLATDLPAQSLLGFQHTGEGGTVVHVVDMFHPLPLHHLLTWTHCTASPVVQGMTVKEQQ